jgi:maltooligosyltrehalose synthase
MPLLSTLYEPQSKQLISVLGESVWQDTQLLTPGIDPRWNWHNVLTGEPVVFVTDDGPPTLALATLLGQCPVALLVAQEDL